MRFYISVMTVVEFPRVVDEIQKIVTSNKNNSEKIATGKELNEQAGTSSGKGKASSKKIGANRRELVRGIHHATPIREDCIDPPCARPVSDLDLEAWRRDTCTRIQRVRSLSG